MLTMTSSPAESGRREMNSDPGGVGPEQTGPDEGPRHSPRQSDDGPTQSGRECSVCRKQGSWTAGHTADERCEAGERPKAGKHTKDKGKCAAYREPLSASGDANPSSSNDHDSDQDLSPCLDGIAIKERLHPAEADDEEDAVHQPASSFATSFFHDTYVDGDGPVCDRYASGAFQGIVPDTSATGFSTAGHSQVTALQRIQPAEVRPNRRVLVRFGQDQPVESRSVVIVDTPFGPIRFHVVPVNTPFILCLTDMDRLGIYFNNIDNVLCQGSITVPVARKWGHPWMLLGPVETISTDGKPHDGRQATPALQASAQNWFYNAC
ncbi:hypothetical protein CTA2_4704 [Colletotrichum tanaceti]|uniref:Uncharacterized protein n=1 Tax=Colletotrichum tanaceti TaxID=1306861 RepID=A0A4V6DHS4_9PEZI|nr:hypothetical protein CTA2_4704 [Colletotrichum tanaceti]TKW57716.1 hypothetical protein CTA1_11512 [Colletotrichum tanaceti]